ncbi:hypothetical protein TWF694_003085 [Orbilia ellipsospora]|uniref:Uncharacterized protein n=1 Tax=Orbilia ellipsospora TaxID=2528407 RepID=A0AAV9X0P9_9PEZI
MKPLATKTAKLTPEDMHTSPEHQQTARIENVKGNPVRDKEMHGKLDFIIAQSEFDALASHRSGSDDLVPWEYLEGNELVDPVEHSCENVWEWPGAIQDG